MGEKPRRRSGGREGTVYYIVLLLCVAAIGICGYFLTKGMLAVKTGGFGQEASAVSGQAQMEDRRESIRRQERMAQKVKEAAEKAAETAEAAAVPETEPAGETVQPTAAAAPEEKTAEEPVQEEAADTAAYVWPVEGTVDRPFSLEAFAYDPTMGDWRTHDGLDIAAETGAVVSACAAGTVESVEDDNMLGMTVTVDHGMGLKSVYANLDEAVDVDAGDPVEPGTVLGTVGTTAVAENAEPSHLHFAMKEYGAAVDPLNYLH